MPDFEGAALPFGDRLAKRNAWPRPNCTLHGSDLTKVPDKNLPAFHSARAVQKELRDVVGARLEQRENSRRAADGGTFLL
jgi:hypothetical protein